RPSRRCSVEPYASPNPLASSSARSKTRVTSRDRVGAAALPDCFGNRSSSRSVSAFSRVTLSPAFWSRGTTIPSSCDSSAWKRWASLTTGLPRSRATPLACCNASAALTVNRSGLIIAPALRATFVPAERCRIGRAQVKMPKKASIDARRWLCDVPAEAPFQDACCADTLAGAAPRHGGSRLGAGPADHPGGGSHGPKRHDLPLGGEPRRSPRRRLHLPAGRRGRAAGGRWPRQPDLPASRADPHPRGRRDMGRAVVFLRERA